MGFNSGLKGLNVILYLSTCHIIYVSVLTFFTIMTQLIINTYISLTLYAPNYIPSPI
jgi:predicted nucleic acid-binding protein